MHLHEELLARRVQVQVVGSIVLANNRRSVAPQHPHAESVQSRSSRPISGALDHAVSGAFAHYWTIQWGVCDATHTSGVEAERKLTRHAAAVCEEIQIMCTVSHGRFCGPFRGSCTVRDSRLTWMCMSDVGMW